MGLLGMQASQMHPRWGKAQSLRVSECLFGGKGLHRLPRASQLFSRELLQKMGVRGGALKGVCVYTCIQACMCVC